MRRDQVLIDRFGGNVRKVRVRRGFSQTDLAGRVGLAVTEVSGIERGAREVRLTTLVRLSAALNVDPGELVDSLPLTAPATTGRR
jgi:transcriptional regulator with XRE-family HTH domain